MLHTVSVKVSYIPAVVHLNIYILNKLHRLNLHRLEVVRLLNLGLPLLPHSLLQLQALLLGHDVVLNCSTFFTR